MCGALLSCRAFRLVQGFLFEGQGSSNKAETILRLLAQTPEVHRAYRGALRQAGQAVKHRECHSRNLPSLLVRKPGNISDDHSKQETGAMYASCACQCRWFAQRFIALWTSIFEVKFPYKIYCIYIYNISTKSKSLVRALP